MGTTPLSEEENKKCGFASYEQFFKQWALLKGLFKHHGSVGRGGNYPILKDLAVAVGVCT